MATTDVPNDRQYPTRPVVGVGAVVVKDDEVLIVRRGAEPGYGEWTLPGGAVELGETLREAVAREVAEECGIAVEVGEVVEVFDRVVRDDSGRVRFHYILIDFAAGHKYGKLLPASDVLDARWVRVDELQSVSLPAIAVSVIRKAIERING